MDLEVDQGRDQVGVPVEATGQDTELTNTIVTVSLLQVALRAEARRMQVALNEIAAIADRTTSEGLFELLQQTCRLLLDYSRCWTHVLASSQTVNTVEAAEVLYNQWLVREQGKGNVATLSQVNGQLPASPAIAATLEDPAYIVVTLIMGTADDQPLFEEIYSASMLRDTLEDIRIIQSRYLLVLETLWAPQNPHDSLTEAELATDYPGLSGIA